MGKLELIDADTLYYTAIDHPKMLIDGLLSTGLAVLSGDSKIGKSWMVLWFCLQIARGEPIWGIPTTKTDVVYLVVERAGTLVAAGQHKLPVVEHGELNVLVVQHLAGDAAGFQDLIEQIVPVTEQAGTDPELEGVPLDGPAFPFLAALAHMQVGDYSQCSFLDHIFYSVSSLLGVAPSFSLPRAERLVEMYTVSPPGTGGWFSFFLQSLIV